MYEELLNKANVPFLHIKRIRTMAVETFRILSDMSPPVLSDLVRIRDCSSYNFRYQNVLQVPHVRIQEFLSVGVQVSLTKKSSGNPFF